MTGRAVSMLRRLSSAFRKDTGSNNYKILGIQARELDEAAGVIEDIAGAHNLDLSTGQSLDYLAELLEVERNGLSDDDFRALVASAGVFRMSNGTIDDIKNLVSSVTGVPTGDIVVNEEADNSFSVRMESPNRKAFSIKILIDRINDARAAGVKFLSDQILMVLNPVRETHITGEGAIIRKLVSEFQFGCSIFGEGTYGDPCETHRTLPGTFSRILGTSGYGITAYGSNYGDPST